MKISRYFRATFLPLVVGCLLTTCTPDSQSSVSPASRAGFVDLPFRIKTLTEDLSQYQGMKKVMPFWYDPAGRYVESMRFVTPDSAAWPVDRTSIQYDAQGRITTLMRTVQERISTFLPYAERYVYAYDAAGTLTETEHYTAWGSGKPLTLYDRTRWQFADGRPTKTTVTFYDNNQPNGRVTESSYAYTDGNLTTYITTFRQAGQPDQQLRSTIRYDSQLNPYAGQPSMRFYFEAPYLVWSRNNPVAVITDGIADGLTYAYEYNSDSLPTLRREMLKGAVTQVLRYEYERL